MKSNMGTAIHKIDFQISIYRIGTIRDFQFDSRTRIQVFIFCNRLTTTL